MNAKKFLQYGINFRQVETLEDVEKLRCTRNLAHVRQQMFNHEEISPEMQKKWFQQLDHGKNFYFIYGLNQVDIGVVNITNVDFLLGVGDAGIYVSNEFYFGSHFNIGALLFLYGYAFEVLNLKSIRARILPSNAKAIRMNLSLGFKLMNNEESTYLLSQDSYRQSALKFERFFSN
jgi:RimJ/RimL family protein N-acetyltransferase